MKPRFSYSRKQRRDASMSRSTHPISMPKTATPEHGSRFSNDQEVIYVPSAVLQALQKVQEELAEAQRQYQIQAGLDPEDLGQQWGKMDLLDKLVDESMRPPGSKGVSSGFAEPSSVKPKPSQDWMKNVQERKARHAEEAVRATAASELEAAQARAREDAIAKQAFDMKLMLMAKRRSARIIWDAWLSFKRRQKKLQEPEQEAIEKEAIEKEAIEKGPEEQVMGVEAAISADPGEARGDAGDALNDDIEAEDYDDESDGFEQEQGRSAWSQVEARGCKAKLVTRESGGAREAERAAQRIQQQQQAAGQGGPVALGQATYDDLNLRQEDHTLPEGAVCEHPAELSASMETSAAQKAPALPTTPRPAEEDLVSGLLGGRTKQHAQKFGGTPLNKPTKSRGGKLHRKPPKAQAAAAGVSGPEPPDVASCFLEQRAPTGMMDMFEKSGGKDLSSMARSSAPAQANSRARLIEFDPAARKPRQALKPARHDRLDNDVISTLLGLDSHEDHDFGSGAAAASAADGSSPALDSSILILVRQLLRAAEELALEGHMQRARTLHLQVAKLLGGKLGPLPGATPYQGCAYGKPPMAVKRMRPGVGSEGNQGVPWWIQDDDATSDPQLPVELLLQEKSPLQQNHKPVSRECAGRQVQQAGSSGQRRSHVQYGASTAHAEAQALRLRPGQSHELRPGEAGVRMRQRYQKGALAPIHLVPTEEELMVPGSAPEQLLGGLGRFQSVELPDTRPRPPASPPPQQRHQQHQKRGEAGRLSDPAGTLLLPVPPAKSNSAHIGSSSRYLEAISPYRPSAHAGSSSRYPEAVFPFGPSVHVASSSRYPEILSPFDPSALIAPLSTDPESVSPSGPSGTSAAGAQTARSAYVGSSMDGGFGFLLSSPRNGMARRNAPRKEMSGIPPVRAKSSVVDNLPNTLRGVSELIAAADEARLPTWLRNAPQRGCSVPVMPRLSTGGGKLTAGASLTLPSMQADAAAKLRTSLPVGIPVPTLASNRGGHPSSPLMSNRGGRTCKITALVGSAPSALPPMQRSRS